MAPRPRLLVERASLALLLLLFDAGSFAGVSAPFQLVTNARNVIVWQEFHPWLMITEDLTDGRACYYLDHNNKSKMTFKTPDPGAWTPLGSAIKWLMFVDYYQGRDRLMAHDVDIHADYIAWPSMQKQVGVGMAGTKCVYGQYRATMVGDHYPVDLRDYNVQNGQSTPAVTSDSEKSQFAHDGNLIVYRAYLGSGVARIHGHYFNSATEFEIAPRDGTSPSVCGSLVAWAEVNGPGFNIVAKDISTQEMRTIAYTTANPPRPQAGRNAIFWQDARSTPPSPPLPGGDEGGVDIHGYDWQTRQEFPVTTASGDQFRLRGLDDLVTWVTGVSPYQTLWGAWIVDTISYTGAVTGVTSEAFYCQPPLFFLSQGGDEGEVGAVKVVPRSGQPAVSVGQNVTVNGRQTTDPEFLGKVITDAAVTQQGSLTAKPVAMSNGSIGEMNAWMLVKSWGRVSGLQTSGGCRFHMSDGSPESTVYVTSPFPAPAGLTNGAFVTVEGISRTSRTTGRQIEVVVDGKTRMW